MLYNKNENTQAGNHRRFRGLWERRFGGYSPKRKEEPYETGNPLRLYESGRCYVG